MVVVIWMLVTIFLFQVWLTLLYKKSKKIILSLPYLLIIFITPFYIFLDQHILVEILGCGCVPMYQTNMLNIPFNANDLRIVVYSILTIICLIIGVLLSKKIDNKVHKIIYVLLILIFNVLFSIFVHQISFYG